MLASKYTLLRGSGMWPLHMHSACRMPPAARSAVCRCSASGRTSDSQPNRKCYQLSSSAQQSRHSHWLSNPTGEPDADACSLLDACLAARCRSRMSYTGGSVVYSNRSSWFKQVVRVGVGLGPRASAAQLLSMPHLRALPQLQMVRSRHLGRSTTSSTAAPGAVKAR